MSELTGKIYGFALRHHDAEEIESLLIENMNNPDAFVICAISIGHMAMRFGSLSDALEERLQQVWPDMKNLRGAQEAINTMNDDLDHFINKKIVLD